MLSKQTIERILIAALSRSGDFAEVYIERTKTNGLSAINGRIEQADFGLDFGVGIRIFLGIRSVYVYANTLDELTLIQMATDASASLPISDQALPTPLNDKNVFQSQMAILKPSSVDNKEIAALLKNACGYAKAYSKNISQTSASCSGIERNICIANSEGLYIEDERVRTRFSVQAVASSGAEKQTGHLSPGAGKGFEYIQSLDIKALSEESARIASTMIDARPCPSGQFPVIIGNGFGGVIFHEACGHALEATSVGIKASVFADRLGEKIAADCVSAVDDPTIEGEWGSFKVDDEGIVPQKNILIENGVLKGYLIDRMGQRRMNMPSTGSGRRQNYRYAPTSRMSNTYILNGDSSLNTMISDTEYGLYAASMGGGSVDPATGEFNFAVNEAYMIRDGKIAEAVRGATLIGKGSEILTRIDRVGNDFDSAQGVCGSISGHVPTNVGQPSLRVSKITVGGLEK